MAYNPEQRKKYAKTPQYRKYQRDYGRKKYFMNKEKSREKSRKYSMTINGKYAFYKHSSKKRGLAFEVSLKDFGKITKLPCTYCGIMPNPFNGVDRKDNMKGYITENCVPCCKKCNFMKGNSSVEDFIKKCWDIVEYTKI